MRIVRRRVPAISVNDETPVIKAADDPDGTFYSVEPRPNAFWRPFQVIDRIDERRFVVTASDVLTRLDPLMSRRHRQRLRARVRLEYDLMRNAAPGLFELDGAVDLTLNHLAWLNYDSGHYFAYVPKALPGEKLGLFVFLHGNGGNFRLFLWRWRSLAAKARVVIVAPSFGFGFWGRESARIVDAAMVDAVGRWPSIDTAQGLWLSGLSAGGSGVIRLIHSRTWHGLIFLSATMPRKLARRACAPASRSVPDMLVLNGALDHNVSPASVSKGVDVFRSGDVRIDHHIYNEEDHFMIFGVSEDVDSRIFAWMLDRLPGVSDDQYRSAP